MNFDDIKDRIKAELQKYWDLFQESGFYNQLRDRYENLTPTMQKLTVSIAVAILVLIMISFPLRYYSSSSDFVSDFNDKRALIVDLLKAVKNSQSLGAVDTTKVDLTMMINRITADLQNDNLSPDQMNPPEVVHEKSNLIPENLNGGTIQVRLAKLNIRQVSDIGYQLENLHPRLKLKDMIVEGAEGLAGYFNVTYKIINVAAQTPPPSAADAKGGKQPPKGRL